MAKTPHTDAELVFLCLQQDAAGQRALYERYAPRLLGVCRRYVGVLSDAEDVLAEVMLRAFTHLHQFEGNGALEGWLRRIAVTQSLMFLRKNKSFLLHEPLQEHHQPATDAPIEVQLSAQDILHLLAELPPGYRTIFNLFVLEGYKHQEIADLLGISPNTSKTQLLLAKQKMQQLIRHRYGKDFYQP